MNHITPIARWYQAKGRLGRGRIQRNMRCGGLPFASACFHQGKRVGQSPGSAPNILERDFWCLVYGRVVTPGLNQRGTDWWAEFAPLPRGQVLQHLVLLKQFQLLYIYFFFFYFSPKVFFFFSPLYFFPFLRALRFLQSNTLLWSRKITPTVQQSDSFLTPR